MNNIERHFFISISREETIQTIVGTVNARKGIFVLTGEKETGKSTLIKLLPTWLKNTKIIEINTEYSNLSEFYEEILNKLGKKIPANTSEKDKANLLQKTAEDSCSKGENILVVVDNADTYNASTLDIFFTLADFKKNGDHLIQTLLVCDYEGLASLKECQKDYEEQVISAIIDLKPFSYSESKLFIIDYLSEMDINPEKLNETDFKIIHEYTKGMAGNISKLIDLYFSKHKSKNEETVGDFSKFISKFKKTGKTKTKAFLLTFVLIILLIAVASIYYSNFSQRDIIISKESPQNKTSAQIDNKIIKDNNTSTILAKKDTSNNEIFTGNETVTLILPDTKNSPTNLTLLKRNIILEAADNDSTSNYSVFPEDTTKAESQQNETISHETIKNCAILKANLNFRKEPSTNSEVITVLSVGREFIIKEKRNGWLKITFDNNTGWIYGSEEYVEISVCK